MRFKPKYKDYFYLARQEPRLPPFILAPDNHPSRRDNESTNVSQNLKGCSETDVNIEVELRSSLPPEVDVFQDFSEPIRPQATPLYLRNKDVDSIEAMNKFTLSLSTFPISATVIGIAGYSEVPASSQCFSEEISQCLGVGTYTEPSSCEYRQDQEVFHLESLGANHLETSLRQFVSQLQRFSDCAQHEKKSEIDFQSCAIVLRTPDNIDYHLNTTLSSLLSPHLKISLPKKATEEFAMVKKREVIVDYLEWKISCSNMTSLTLKSPIWKTETICFSLVSENIYLKSEPDLCMLEGGFGDDGYKEIDSILKIDDGRHYCFAHTCEEEKSCRLSFEDVRLKDIDDVDFYFFDEQPKTMTDQLAFEFETRPGDIASIGIEKFLPFSSYPLASSPEIFEVAVRAFGREVEHFEDDSSDCGRLFEDASFVNAEKVQSPCVAVHVMRPTPLQSSIKDDLEEFVKIQLGTGDTELLPPSCAISKTFCASNHPQEYATLCADIGFVSSLIVLPPNTNDMLLVGLLLAQIIITRSRENEYTTALVICESSLAAASYRHFMQKQFKAFQIDNLEISVLGQVDHDKSNPGHNRVVIAYLPLMNKQVDFRIDVALASFCFASNIGIVSLRKSIVEDLSPVFQRNPPRQTVLLTSLPAHTLNDLKIIIDLLSIQKIVLCPMLAKLAGTSAAKHVRFCVSGRSEKISNHIAELSAACTAVTFDSSTKDEKELLENVFVLREQLISIHLSVLNSDVVCQTVPKLFPDIYSSLSRLNEPQFSQLVDNLQVLERFFAGGVSIISGINKEKLGCLHSILKDEEIRRRETFKSSVGKGYTLLVLNEVEEMTYFADVLKTYTIFRWVDGAEISSLAKSRDGGAEIVLTTYTVLDNCLIGKIPWDLFTCVIEVCYTWGRLRCLLDLSPRRNELQTCYSLIPLLPSSPWITPQDSFRWIQNLLTHVGNCGKRVAENVTVISSIELDKFTSDRAILHPKSMTCEQLDHSGNEKGAIIPCASDGKAETPVVLIVHQTFVTKFAIVVDMLKNFFSVKCIPRNILSCCDIILDERNCVKLLSLADLYNNMADLIDDFLVMSSTYDKCYLLVITSDMHDFDPYSSLSISDGLSILDQIASLGLSVVVRYCDTEADAAKLVRTYCEATAKTSETWNRSLVKWADRKWIHDSETNHENFLSLLFGFDSFKAQAVLTCLTLTEFLSMDIHYAAEFLPWIPVKCLRAVLSLVTAETSGPCEVSKHWNHPFRGLESNAEYYGSGHQFAAQFWQA